MKMKTFTKLSLLFLSFAFIVSCGNADDDVFFGLNTGDGLGKGKPVDDCLGLGEGELVLSIQEQFTTLPGKVSILFKVSDSDGLPVSGLVADQFLSLIHI